MKQWYALYVLLCSYALILRKNFSVLITLSKLFDDIFTKLFMAANPSSKLMLKFCLTLTHAINLRMGLTYFQALMSPRLVFPGLAIPMIYDVIQDTCFSNSCTHLVWIWLLVLLLVESPSMTVALCIYIPGKDILPNVWLCAFINLEKNPQMLCLYNWRDMQNFVIATDNLLQNIIPKYMINIDRFYTHVFTQHVLWCDSVCPFFVHLSVHQLCTQ